MGDSGYTRQVLPQVTTGREVGTLARRAELADEFDFVSALNNAGVAYSSITDIVKVGRAICHDLSVSVAPPGVLAKLRDIGFGAYESRAILLAAIDTLYDHRNPTVISWMRANGY